MGKRIVEITQTALADMAADQIPAANYGHPPVPARNRTWSPLTLFRITFRISNDADPVLRQIRILTEIRRGTDRI